MKKRILYPQDVGEYFITPNEKQTKFPERKTIMTEATLETTEATEATQSQKQGKQGQPIPYIGHGNYTPNMLSTWSGVEKRLLARGHSQASLDFIFSTTICSKGHDEYLNQSAAAEKFFPGVSAITAKCRVQKVMADFMRQLFSGQQIEGYQKIWDEAHKKSESNSIRPRLSVEEKATRIATHDLKVAFRKAEEIGGRGRLKPDVQEKLDRYLEKYLPNAIKKIMSDLQG